MLLSLGRCRRADFHFHVIICCPLGNQPTSALLRVGPLFLFFLLLPSSLSRRTAKKKKRPKKTCRVLHILHHFPPPALIFLPFRLSSSAGRPADVSPDTRMTETVTFPGRRVFFRVLSFVSLLLSCLLNGSYCFGNIQSRHFGISESVPHGVSNDHFFFPSSMESVGRPVFYRARSKNRVKQTRSNHVDDSRDQPAKGCQETKKKKFFRGSVSCTVA